MRRNEPIIHASGVPALQRSQPHPGGAPAKEAKCGRCHRPVFESKALPASAATFERHRMRNDIPIVVDFWAPRCTRCRAMVRAYERAAAELEPDYRLLKVNAEEEPALAERYQVRAIPTMMLFARGEPIAQTAGASAPGIVKWVRAHGEGQPQPRAASGSG
jgi:thioredoxin 2